jgi:UDP-N-acetylglucosamine:LPS N-acetylglucosamine transferase
MKIALISSHGGHLTEMYLLMKAFENQDFFFITYENPTTNKLKYKKYTTEEIGTNIWIMIKTFFQILLIYRKEKPDLIVSTGAEIAIPSIIMAKFMRIKTIFIESWCRVKTKSGSGRILYFIADEFLVQWPELIKIYGKKSKYAGAVF